MSFIDHDPPREASPMQAVMLGASALWIVAAATCLIYVLQIATAICGNQCNETARVMTYGWMGFGAAMAFSGWLVLSAIRRTVARRLLVAAFIVDVLMAVPFVGFFILLATSGL
ncbi:MAG TPA: hypothetical protein VGW40_04570 [Allosphingosinicella sp.]|nr:hypothetical protein [Allosphingosinicella sp.]